MYLVQRLWYGLDGLGFDSGYVREFVLPSNSFIMPLWQTVFPI